MLHCIGDFERLSDHAVNIKESADELHAKGLSFSVYAKAGTQSTDRSSDQNRRNSVFCIWRTGYCQGFRDWGVLEELIDELTKEMKRRHINRLLLRRVKIIEMGFILSDPDHWYGKNCRSLFQYRCLRNLCVRAEFLWYTQTSERNKNDQDDEFTKCLEEMQRISASVLSVKLKVDHICCCGNSGGNSLSSFMAYMKIRRTVHDLPCGRWKISGASRLYPENYRIYSKGIW